MMFIDEKKIIKEDDIDWEKTLVIDDDVFNDRSFLVEENKEGKYFLVLKNGRKFDLATQEFVILKYDVKDVEEEISDYIGKLCSIHDPDLGYGIGVTELENETITRDIWGLYEVENLDFNGYCHPKDLITMDDIDLEKSYGDDFEDVMEDEVDIEAPYILALKNGKEFDPEERAFAVFRRGQEDLIDKIKATQGTTYKISGRPVRLTGFFKHKGHPSFDGVDWEGKGIDKIIAFCAIENISSEPYQEVQQPQGQRSENKSMSEQKELSNVDDKLSKMIAISAITYSNADFESLGKSFFMQNIASDKRLQMTQELKELLQTNLQKRGLTVFEKETYKKKLEGVDIALSEIVAMFHASFS